MNLKKLLLLVFLHMMENETDKLESSLGNLSVGGIIYIAKMAGLNDVGKLMTKLSEIEEKYRKDKLNDYENITDSEDLERKELLNDILEEFEN